MNEMRVREEILSAGGTDIGIYGGDRGKYEFYYGRLDDLNSGRIDLETARNAIGAAYVQGGITSITDEPYEEYHGNWYIKEYLPYREKIREQNKGKANGTN